ncbi:hypothetical protein Plhal304r1_c101g0175041 [Plasmopara halstedii]
MSTCIARPLYLVLLVKVIAPGCFSQLHAFCFPVTHVLKQITSLKNFWVQRPKAIYSATAELSAAVRW